MTRRFMLCLAAVLAVGACNDQQEPMTGNSNPESQLASGSASIGVNVILKTPATAANRTELAKFGTLLDEIAELKAIRVRTTASQLPAIQALRFVAAATPDAERTAVPVDAVAATDFAAGINTWDQDAINVTDFGSANRQVGYDGTDVYVGILDTGLLPTWRQYFPEQRIATQYAKSFGGGGQDNGNVSEQPNKWESDVNSHGTHVTSTILGYQMATVNPPRLINGTAPKAIIIPVKVLNQNGSGWSSAIARGIRHITELKKTVLAGHPVVINMSLGGPELDALEKAAIDEAVAAGVIIVASAGNNGELGMGYPGAYAPVISVAASGWIGEWTPCAGPNTGSAWWRLCNVPDPTKASNFYITDFSSRQKPGQDLDVAAPGSWVVGPYQVNQSNTISFFFLGGTSMASPHVAGIVALMAQKNHGLTALQAENILQSSAKALPAGCRNIVDPNVGPTRVCWGADATGAGLATANAALAATP
jgi:subtilisin family serine protease